MGMAVLGFLLNLTPERLSGWAWMVVCLQLVVLASLYLAFAFAVNNCYDAQDDALNPEKRSINPVASGRVSLKATLIFCALLVIAAAALAGLWLWANPACLASYASLLLLGWAYSSPPLRLKSIPVADLASHGLFFGCLLILFGALLLGPPQPQVTLLLPSVFLYSMALELRNHLEDLEVDREAGTRTSAVWLGRRRSRILLQFLLLGHLLAGLAGAILVWGWVVPIWVLPFIGLFPAAVWYWRDGRVWLRVVDGIMLSLFGVAAALTAAPMIILFLEAGGG